MIDKLITDVMRREGWDKYTNHPADRGGPTKWGITLRAWSDYLGQEMTPADVQAITEFGARRFYEQVYFKGPSFDRLPSRLWPLVFDCGVNHGVRAASKWVQRAAGSLQDGWIGPKTLEAVSSVPAAALSCRVLAYRIKLYGRLVSKDPKLSAAKEAGFRLQAEFAAGWNNRAAEFLLSLADELAGQVE